MKIVLWSCVINNHVWLMPTEEKANKIYNAEWVKERNVPPHMQVFNVDENGKLNEISYSRYDDLIAKKNLTFLEPNHPNNQLVDVLLVDHGRDCFLSLKNWLENNIIKEEGEMILEHLPDQEFDTYKVRMKKIILLNLQKYGRFKIISL